VRYGIDNSRRTKHGALLDAEILAEVYIELIGGKQPDLGLMHVRAAAPALQAGAAMAARTPRAIIVRLTDAERDAHRAFVATLGADALWRAYLGGTN
jgi:DNA polymerase-3 subunit epsilon